MPVPKTARAEVAQLRQQTQFTCCATSIAAALRAHGKNVSEEDVNLVLAASPMAGASWEAMLATVQYFGCRGTLVVPATPRMLKTWTDAGVPVVIAWNPEGRPWSHASTVYDVVEGEDGKLTVYIMDPNIPNPTETTRILGEDEFCQKWGEKVSESLIMRRPAMAVEREVTLDGRQVKASTRRDSSSRFESIVGGGAVTPHTAKITDTVKIKKEDLPKQRHGPQYVQDVMRRPGAGTHHTRTKDVNEGRSRKEKHNKDWADREAELTAAWGFPKEEL
jgi:hypothetical protein